MAGCGYADVSLWLIGLDGDRTQVEWDREAFEYLVAGCWDRPDPGPLIAVQNRDQRRVRILRADAASGLTELVRRSWWFGESQWFAEQGFAVVVADGRGTPGRGPACSSPAPNLLEH